MADAWVVGNFANNNAFAAVSSTGSMIFLIIGFFSGVATGGGVVISKYFGAKNMDAVDKAVHTNFLFGIIAAKNRGKAIDSVISFFANIGVSMPMFWLGMMGMLVFALKLRVLPSSGYVPITRDFGGWLSHMIMPIIVLSLDVNAGIVRLTRSSMLEVMRQDYVPTARAKGVSKKDVTFRQQLRNSMLPIVPTMRKRLGSMVGSTVLIESLFVIPGLGSVMMNGISNRDFMLVANGVLIISIFVAICNLVVDILYGIIDPRTR